MGQAGACRVKEMNVHNLQGKWAGVRVLDVGTARCPAEDVQRIRAAQDARENLVPLRQEILDGYEGYLEEGGPMTVWVAHLEELAGREYVLVGRTVAVRRDEGTPPRFFVERRELRK